MKKINRDWKKNLIFDKYAQKMGLTDPVIIFLEKYGLNLSR